MVKYSYYVLAFALVLAIGFNLSAQVDPAEFLTHSWTFEDDTADDQVGDADGTLMGDAYIADGSLFTDLGNSWVELPPEVIALNTYDEISVEVWVVPGENPGVYTMVTYFGNSVNGFGSNGYFISLARGDGITRTAISTNDEATPWASETHANGPVLTVGELYHVVSTLTDENISYYLNGELQETKPLDDHNNIASIGTALALLAAGGYTADPTWRGEILEVNIYNKELSLDEVLFLYTGSEPGVTEVGDSHQLPAAYGLMQNYPNPFNPTTNISFELPEQAHVRLAVYNVLGQELAVLVNGEKSAGRHTVQFDGASLSSGVYITRMETDGRMFTNKMILAK
jgi:hypothetical protein